jgi:hypothetical protein
VSEKEFIAERRLLYSLKGGDVRKEFIIRLGAPYLVKEGMEGFSIVGEAVSACHIEIVGIDETYPEVYGVDSLQAINLASNVEGLLKWLQKTYNIYWPCGDPYFDTPD